jgi:hypothetical protein
MKTYTLTGIILIVIGIAALAYQGITYTTREKVVDIGPIQMTAEKTKSFPCRRSWEGSRSWAALYCWSWEARRPDQRQNISDTSRFV